MPKIAFIGGGSAKFVQTLVIDILDHAELQNVEFVLMDIDRERVERTRRVVEKIIAELRVPATVSATLDRREALAGADYVVITIMVGGYECYRRDVEIPARHGIYQTVSDTIGPGAICRIIRTAPVLRQLAEDLRAVSPQAWVLNYANPMAMNVWTLNRCGHARTVGLCHSIQGCVEHTLSAWLNLPAREIRYTAGGINHLDFYLTLEHQGRDLYPELLAAAPRILEKAPAERARFELLESLGHFPAEGPYHQSEYYPWFRKDERMVAHYAAETGWGYRNDSTHFKTKVDEAEEILAGRRKIEYKRSLEYGSGIIHALATGKPSTFYGNVPNRGLIENLPPQAMVEVPCVAEADAIRPCRVGAIPPQLAAVMTPHIAVHELAVRGALEGDRTLLRQALQADPLTGAILTLPRIRELADELFAANAEYLPA